SVASKSSQSSQVQKPYYPSAFGQATGPYNSAYRKPDGGSAVPGILDHQRRSDYYNIHGKTHDATANYNAKFNATYNAIQGAATAPTFERVVETLQTIETNKKIANHKLNQYKQQQKRERRQQALSHHTPLLDRVAEKAEIPTYSSVLTKDILEGYIGSRDIDFPIANADQSKPFYRHHEYFDEDIPIPDANPQNPEATAAN
ncbi:hypothetical protein HDU76_009576, partial [Blyttiomyces sp. JEL0837]